MMANRYKRLIVLPFLICVTYLKSQSTLEINGKRIINPGESFSIGAGTIVTMGPGAVLDVRGNLNIAGTPENPVTFVNANESVPAVGIQISGIEDGGTVKISSVSFDGLIQPLRFDPFWYRKTVKINDLSIRNSSSFEPIVYVASPFIDLREDKKIILSINNASIVNNASGLLIESYGSNGIEYQFDKLYFGDNQLSGTDKSLGLLHLEFANNSTEGITKIGNLAFERNEANGFPLGLSVGGTSTYKVEVGGIYGSNSDEVVFDQKKDIRLPEVIVKTNGNLNDFGKTDYIKTINHNYGDLFLTSNGNVGIRELLTEEGTKVEINRRISGDTQHYEYIQGNPAYAILTDGRKVKLPAILPDKLPEIQVTKIDTAEFNKFKLNTELSGDGGKEKSDVLSIGVNIPTFASKGEIVKKIRVWEFGLWGGGGIYGAGDIKPKFFGLPSTIDVSGGLYGQYNFNSRFSLKATGYRTTISIHDLYSIGLFSGTKPLMAYNEYYEEFISSPNSYRVHFTTDMWIGEIEGLWHLRSYQIKEGSKSKIIPSLGLSLGILHYTPYKYAYTNQKNNETRADYLDRMKSQHRYNLRELGSEGQNFLPNSNPYSKIALNIGSSFSITYLFKRLAFKGEMRAAYTNTDYLDDFGPGFWYGGDVDALRANHKLQFVTREADLNKIIGFDERIAKNAPRSVDGLNDWYYQLHLGMSYILIK